MLDAALAQLPVDPRQQQVIVRTDAGGTSHELAVGARKRHVNDYVGVTPPAHFAEVIRPHAA